MRLKNLRDGMEDYEYFALLEQRGGAERCRALSTASRPTWWEYTRDPQALLDARRELAEAIMAPIPSPGGRSAGCESATSSTQAIRRTLKRWHRITPLRCRS
jgi:hypothetical protein